MASGDRVTDRRGTRTRRAGSIVSSAYVGVTHATEPDPSGNGGVLRLWGLGALSHGGASISGWIERALVRFGAQNVRVFERNYEAGVVASSELVLELSWD